MDAKGHGDRVLSGILGGGGSMRALAYAEKHLTIGHFEDPRQKVLWEVLCRYAAQSRGIVTRPGLEDVLRNRKPGGVAMYAEYYGALAKVRLLPHEFLHSVEQLRVLAAERETGEAFARAMEILRSPDGVKLEDGTELRGHEDARSWVMSQLAVIERDMKMTESPEGDVNDDADAVLTAYARAKELQLRGEAPGVKFGVPALDGYMDGGVGPGEMAVILAGTTIGKSRWCVQHAWHAAVEQGKNVVYFTTETLRPQILTNLIARHSLLPQFGLDRGLNARKIRAGRLSPSEESALDWVIKDFKTADYGRLRVVQMPEHCTMSVLAARHAAIERQFVPDLDIADYLQLFEPERRGRDSREHENLAGILKRAERWCASANKGRGVAFETPWQVNRGGRQGLRTNGGYTLEDSGGTQEAANTPDIVLALEDREEDTSEGRRVPLEMKVLKNRDGPRGHRFPLMVDYATCHFADRDEPVQADLDLEGLPG